MYICMYIYIYIHMKREIYAHITPETSDLHPPQAANPSHRRDFRAVVGFTYIYIHTYIRT